MKKLAVVVAMLVSAIASSYGIVSIDWAAGGGFYFTVNPFDGILGEGTGKSTVAKLMYSPDATKDDILASMAGDVNDVIWDTITITEDGVGGGFDSYALFSKHYENATFTAGWVYALIYQDSSVAVGDWYFYTPMLALSNVAGPVPGPQGLPQDLQMNTDMTNGNAIDSLTGGGVSTAGLVAQVVPEPATALLFGIGAMGAWMVRRNKIKSKEQADA